jgi:hypothetical protein
MYRQRIVVALANDVAGQDISHHDAPSVEERRPRRRRRRLGLADAGLSNIRRYGLRRPTTSRTTIRTSQVGQPPM